MAALLVQHVAARNKGCVRNHNNNTPLGLDIPSVNLSWYTGTASTARDSNDDPPPQYHTFNTASTTTSATATPTNVPGVIVEPRVYPLNGGHTKHTHASYRRGCITELDGFGSHNISKDGWHFANGYATPTGGASSSWVLNVPIPIPHGFSSNTLESLVYTVRYASLGAGSATVQTDVVLSHGGAAPEGVITDYTKLALYHYGHNSGEKKGDCGGYGPPMLNEALGMRLASVPSHKGGDAGGWSHYLDHREIYPNVRIDTNHDNTYAAHVSHPHVSACHLNLFFHVYEYPGADAFRSISVDVSATWNDGTELQRLKDEKIREADEIKQEREKLIIAKNDAELTIKRLEESAKKAIEESEERRKAEEAVEKELEEREAEFLAAEKKARAAFEQRKKDEEGRFKAFNEAEKKAKTEHERRMQEEDTRFNALSEAEKKAAAEHERRMREEAEELKAIDQAEARAKQEYTKITTYEEEKKKEFEDAQKKFKEEHERMTKEDMERHQKEEAEHKAHEEAEQKFRDEQAKWATDIAEQRKQEGAEVKAREAAERKAKEEAEKLVKEIAEQREAARAEGEKLKHEIEEAERKALEEASKKSIAAAPAVADEKMQQDIAQAAARVGQQCGGGYAWVKQGDGYKCSGGGHFVSFKDLGMQ